MTTETISAQVEDYLDARRAMGFELKGEGYQLRAFARFASGQGEAGALTMDLLLRSVQGAAAPGPVTAARRVEVLRPFVKYYRQFEPACPVIPLDHCGPGHRRLSPHIHTEAEVVALLDAALELKPDGLRPLTYVTLFGLLAATGLRLSEALGLERTDLNLADASIKVRQTKFKKSRLVPIHVSTAKALADYQHATLRAQRRPGVETVFVTPKGCPIPNLRHTFICRALLRGQQDNQIDHVVDAISTYVGHAKVSDTYWYISATPALMSEASQRFFRFCSGGSP
jgi:integrase